MTRSTPVMSELEPRRDRAPRHSVERFVSCGFLVDSHQWAGLFPSARTDVSEARPDALTEYGAECPSRLGPATSPDKHKCRGQWSRFRKAAKERLSGRRNAARPGASNHSVAQSKT